MVKKITSFKMIQMYTSDYGARYYLREMADRLGKPHQTIRPYADMLAEEGILKESQRKNLTEFTLNLKDKRAYDYLVIAEKESLLERLRKDTYLKVLFEKLSPSFERATFVIFGSAADKIKEGSDIDLLVIGACSITRIIEDFESVYNKKIHKIQAASLSKLSLTFIKEVYKKHLILNNTEQVVRFFGELYEQNKLV
ncbi:hypothetical protein FJZ53_03185 [Candidatus Woesearchaeota archaeon]|nr:hypothetical protein [Candidatus Woesearchaeota archaeon]